MSQHLTVAMLFATLWKRHAGAFSSSTVGSMHATKKTWAHHGGVWSNYTKQIQKIGSNKQCRHHLDSFSIFHQGQTTYLCWVTSDFFAHPWWKLQWASKETGEPCAKHPAVHNRHLQSVKMSAMQFNRYSNVHRMVVLEQLHYHWQVCMIDHPVQDICTAHTYI